MYIFAREALCHELCRCMLRPSDEPAKPCAVNCAAACCVPLMSSAHKHAQPFLFGPVCPAVHSSSIAANNMISTKHELNATKLCTNPHWEHPIATNDWYNCGERATHCPPPPPPEPPSPNLSRDPSRGKTGHFHHHREVRVCTLKQYMVRSCKFLDSTADRLCCHTILQTESDDKVLKNWKRLSGPAAHIVV